MEDFPMAEEDFDSYQALKDERYKTLLDKEIQLDNARQRAYKNTNASLAAAGMDSSGYAGLNRMGIENQYLQGLQTAQNEFQNVSNAQQEKDTNAFLELMGNQYIDSLDKLNMVFEKSGYMKDGVLDYDALVKRYGKDSADQIAISYELMSGDYKNQQENTVFGDVTVAKNSLVDNNGKTGKLKREVEKLYSIQNTFKDGDVVMLEGRDGNYSFVVLKNGNWYQSTSNEYANAQSKYKLKNTNNFDDMVLSKPDGTKTSI